MQLHVNHWKLSITAFLLLLFLLLLLVHSWHNLNLKNLVDHYILNRRDPKMIPMNLKRSLARLT